MTTQATIVDQQQAYPPTLAVIDRPTDDTLDFIAACEEIRRRHRDDLEDQIERATTRLVHRLNRQRRHLHAGRLRQAACQEVVYARRRMADQELAGMQPTAQLLHDAEQHDDTELYRCREQALAVLLDDRADSYAYMAPRVLADRESVCRQQTLLVDEQEQATRQLRQLRGVRGLVSQRRVCRLHADLAELDRQLTQVQGQIRHQQALLDVIQAADANRSAWLTRHQDVLHQGAAAVIVLTRRLLAAANPPGSVRPDREVDLDHPKGHDPLALPATNGAAPASASQGARVALATTGQG